MSPETCCLISAILIVLLLFFLLSPNIVYVIHHRHFKWKDDKYDYVKGAIDYCQSPLTLNQFVNELEEVHNLEVTIDAFDNITIKKK